MKLTLRHDHPFWDTHFPPNGWGCKCRVVAVAAPGDGDATTPPDGWGDTDPATGCWWWLVRLGPAPSAQGR